MALRLMLLSLGLVVGARTVQADINVIDAPNAFRLLSGYTQDGFSLTTPDGFWISTPTNGGGSVWYTYNNPYYLGLTAFDAAAIHNADPTISLVYNNGSSLFDMLSIDLAPEYNWEPVHPTINFVGTHADGTQTIDTVTLTSTDNFETFTLPGMSNIVSLTWAQGPWDTQFTDVMVEGLPDIQNIGVPEPSSLSTTVVITAIVLIPIAVKRRRRRALGDPLRFPGESLNRFGRLWRDRTRRRGPTRAGSGAAGWPPPDEASCRRSAGIRPAALADADGSARGIPGRSA